jgi:hypothetical protein
MNNKQKNHNNSRVIQSFNLPQGVCAMLTDIVAREHVSSDDFVADAIMEKIQDILDIEIAKSELAKKEKGISIKEARRVLGLDC